MISFPLCLCAILQGAVSISATHVICTSIEALEFGGVSCAGAAYTAANAVNAASFYLCHTLGKPANFGQAGCIWQACHPGVASLPTVLDCGQLLATLDDTRWQLQQASSRFLGALDKPARVSAGLYGPSHTDVFTVLGMTSSCSGACRPYC